MEQSPGARRNTESNKLASRTIFGAVEGASQLVYSARGEIHIRSRKWQIPIESSKYIYWSTRDEDQAERSLKSKELTKNTSGEWHELTDPLRRVEGVRNQHFKSRGLGMGMGLGNKPTGKILNQREGQRSQLINGGRRRALWHRSTLLVRNLEG